MGCRVSGDSVFAIGLTVVLLCSYSELFDGAENKDMLSKLIAECKAHLPDTSSILMQGITLDCRNSLRWTDKKVTSGI